MCYKHIATPIFGRDTREEARADAAARSREVREKCVNALSDAALTADEVASRIGENILTVRPRMTELGKRGTIVKTKLRRPNKSGKMATVWMLAA